MRNRSKAGFTLVEMLLVLVILSTLAALVVPKLAGRTQQADETAAQSDISTMSNLLDAFEVDNGYYPDTSDGLELLVVDPGDSRWRGPYMEKVPVDPWGNAYIYEYPGSENESGFDLYSMGVDGRENTEDDIFKDGKRSEL